VCDTSGFSLVEDYVVAAPAFEIPVVPFRDNRRTRALLLRRSNLLFKLTAAPFHVWAPSVYGQAPVSSVAFLSIYSKVRVFCLLVKLIFTVFHSLAFVRLPLLRICGILSVLIGRRHAFVETQTKRFFVFSSRGHVGFRLVSISRSTVEGASARLHYLTVYVISSFLR